MEKSCPQSDVPGPVNGVITNVQVYSLHDGPGVRTIGFLKGCPLKCQWCCNPECIGRTPEVEFYGSRCVQCGACQAACPYDALFYDDLTGYYLKCDLCVGREEGPVCAQMCPVGAITVAYAEVAR